MEEKEILEGNKLIAEFMDEEQCLDPKHEGNRCFYYPTMGYITPDKMRYRISWDWLMPAVEKIGTLSYNERGGKFTLDISLSPFLEGDILTVWKHVVEFTKWYNTQKH